MPMWMKLHSSILRHAAFVQDIKHSAFIFAEIHEIDPFDFWDEVLLINRTTALNLADSLEAAKQNRENITKII